MRMLGLMRVKNEGRWLEAALRSISFCDHVLILDDNSTDETPDICAQFKNFVTWIPKAEEVFHDEKNDRETLAYLAARYNPEWICNLAGDEVMLEDTWTRIEPLLPVANVIESLNLHLWNNPWTVRVDGNWKEQYRQTFWRFKPGKLTYAPDHCSIPDQITERPFTRAGVRMLHYASITAQDRRRHYDLYLSHGIDCPWLIQGDPGGPSAEGMELLPLEEALKVVV